MMSQLTVPVSAAELLFITNDVPATIVPTDKIPCTPPKVAWVRNMRELAVTLVFEIVIVPAVIAPETPTDLFEPSAAAIAPFNVVVPVTDNVPPMVALRAKNKSLKRVAPDAPIS